MDRASSIPRRFVPRQIDRNIEPYQGANAKRPLQRRGQPSEGKRLKEE